ncbi:MAG: hypothetical protein M3P48_06025 [Actinomycetota bacterium]|nr:hypothetical protein [Actinomycetota bacterium]
MTPSSRLVTVRRLGLVAAALGLWAALVAALVGTGADAWRIVRGPGAAPFEPLLLLTAVALALLVLTWIAGSVVLTAVTAGGRRVGPVAHAIAGRITPALVHRGVVALLGLSVVTAAAPASAATESRVRVVAAQEQEQGSFPAAGQALPDLDRVPPGPAWLPPKPPRSVVAERAVPLVTTPAHPEHAAAEEVVVRRGDTLWDIAARGLGPGATAEDIAREWPRWYAANAAVIGADPDLLLPGQLLRPPEAAR